MSKPRLPALALLAALALAGLPHPAGAAITTYATVPAFEAATGANSVIDFTGTSFNGLNPDGPNLWNTYSASGFSLGGATFASSGDHYVAIVAPAFSPMLYDRGTGNQAHASFGGSLTITFDTPIDAFALDLSGIGVRSGSVSLSFSNGDTATGTLGNPYGFNGYISSSAFSSVTIGAIANDNLMVDNIRYASALVEEAIPEPVTLALFGFATTALGLFRRRRAG